MNQAIAAGLIEVGAVEENGAPHALEGANCADGGGRRGDAGDWPGVWVHDRTASKDLIRHIDAFIAAYNQTAKPFLWTKSKVHQKRLRPCFPD